MAGPLKGVRIIEIAGIGPGPFCGMMLADHGAEVIRVDRPNAPPPIVPPQSDILARGRRVVLLDLKRPEGIAALRDLARTADGLIEGFRPGVMERLGIGPDLLLADNPKLVFGRMTGWGQDGPLACTAGHDIDYIAVAGALHAYGKPGGPPVPPVNMVGDFGGGGMFLAFGMVSAILHARATGQGQVIDCAMVDGAAVLMSMIWSMRAAGLWRDERGVNLLDTGAHFYDTYETSDGKYLAVGAIEPQFYAEFRRLTGLDKDPDLDAQLDASSWPRLRQKIAATLRLKTRDEWVAIFDGTDACVSPVLSFVDAPTYPHNAARRTFIESDGLTQPAPAPRFSVTQPVTPHLAAADTDAVFAGIGYSEAQIGQLKQAGVIA